MQGTVFDVLFISFNTFNVIEFNMKLLVFLNLKVFVLLNEIVQCVRIEINILYDLYLKFKVYFYDQSPMCSLSHSSQNEYI